MLTGWVPLTYTARSLFVRKTGTLLTVGGIAATVAVFAGVLALQQGFQTLFTQSGRDDVVLFLRLGANSEGESVFPIERANILAKSVPEIAQGPDGQPLASCEQYLAIRLKRLDGGETNVPIRGVQQQTFAIHGSNLRIVEGRRFEPGHDEVIVGRSIARRLRGAQVGEELRINTTKFTVVGVFEHDGPYASEVWGDVDRMVDALERPGYNRVLAQVKPGTDVAALHKRLESDKQVPTKAQTEREYLTSQTKALSFVLLALGNFLAVVMGAAAVLTGTNTMLAALAARTHEVGILSAIGFRPVPIFFSFLLESLFMGVLGGLLGCLCALPLNGVRTGTTNFQTFTEVAFAFRITPYVLVNAVGFAVVLGILAGTVPAWFAARMRPTQALRRE
jgi:putative ABC transport system permease protein